MHILVAALLALSCFIPIFGSMATGATEPIDTDIRSERTMPDIDDRDGDFSYDRNRIRSDRPDANFDDQNGQNGNPNQNGSDADSRTNDQNSTDGTMSLLRMNSTV